MSSLTYSGNSLAKVAVVGATSTDKSTFVQLFRNDNKIVIDNVLRSQPLDIQTAYWTDKATKCSVMLIDTPGFTLGFDESQQGLTATDVLRQLTDYLEPESNEGKKLDGIIYMHPISDPQVVQTVRTNIIMLKALCKDKKLDNVCIVTTNWSGVSEWEGAKRENALKEIAFNDPLNSGARIRRYLNTIESAQQTISEFLPSQTISGRLQDPVKASTCSSCAAKRELEGAYPKSEEELLLRLQAVIQAELRAEREINRQATAVLREDMKKLSQMMEMLYGEVQKLRQDQKTTRDTHATCGDTGRSRQAALQSGRDSGLVSRTGGKNPDG